MPYRIELKDDSLSASQLEEMTGSIARELSSEYGLDVSRKEASLSNETKTKGDEISIAALLISAVAGIGVQKLIELLLGYVTRSKTLRIRVKESDDPASPVLFEITSSDMEYLRGLDAFRILEKLMKYKD